MTRMTMSTRARTRARHLAPFGAAAAAPYLLPLPGGWTVVPLVVSIGLTALVAAAIVAGRWDRWPDWAALVPALTYLAAVAVMREAGGGNVSGVGPMVLLPVMWLALHGTRRVLAVVLVAVPLVYWLPILVEGGGERYPGSGWRIGLLLAVLSATLGLTVQRLHDKVRSQAARLDRLAHQDELTGLPNRRAWLSQLQQALALAGRRGEPLTVAFIDIDRFKAINDADGHEAGDALLVHAARSWSGVLRAGDVLARMGGDEFALLLPDCDATAAGRVLARMRLAPMRATWSAGVTQWNGAEPAEALVHRADALLYGAKRAGRDRVFAGGGASAGAGAGDQRPATLAT
jgi:diguanylate cyclase (GGDEF)-like protein